MSHNEYMELALAEARAAVIHGDVPVGAVVVRSGTVIASRHNERELTNDPTAHAEVLALRDASNALESWYLTECVLYVTLEPCLMCSGALVNSRISAVVYGALDPKGGACASLYSVCSDSRLNHQVSVLGGVLEAESTALLKGFFRDLRNSSKPEG